LIYIKVDLLFLSASSSRFHGQALLDGRQATLRKRREWAILLLGGFAGIGFMAYRRKSKAASMAA
jgi:hypothetical protein